MIINKPNNSQDHLKRFLEKNKTIKTVILQDGGKSKQIKRKLTPKCSFIQCSPLIDKEKIQWVNENKLYKKILMTEDSFNSNIIENHSLSTSSKQSFLKKNRSSKILLNRSKVFGQNQSHQKSTPNLYNKTTIINLSQSSKIEDFNNTKNTSDKVIMNFSTPLKIWKQLSKQYRKNKQQDNNTFDSLCTKVKKQKLMKDKLKVFLQKGSGVNLSNVNINSREQVDQQGQKNLVDDFIEKYGKRDNLSKTNKQRQKQQNKLQNNIILRRSISCDEFQQSKIKYYKNLVNEKNHFITQNQSPTSSQHHSISPKQSHKNSVLLLHKQPLESCIQKYFNPLQSVQKNKQQQLQSIISHQIMRIKSKKLTQRSIEHLEKIKNKLFKQKSRKDLFNNQPGIITFTKASKKYSKQDLLKTVTTMSTQKPSRRSSKKGNHHQLFSKKVNTDVQNNEPIKVNKCNRTNQNLDRIPQLIHLKVAQNNNNHPQTSHTNTPSVTRVTPTSSVISFGDQSNYGKLKKEQKCQSFFNAW